MPHAGVTPKPYDELLAWADNTALLCYAYADYRSSGVVDMQSFLRDVTLTKLAQEVGMLSQVG